MSSRLFAMIEKEAQRQQEAVAAGEQTDWKEAMKQWEDWEAQEIAKLDK